MKRITIIVAVLTVITIGAVILVYLQGDNSELGSGSHHMPESAQEPQVVPDEHQASSNGTRLHDPQPPRGEAGEVETIRDVLEDPPLQEIVSEEDEVTRYLEIATRPEIPEFTKEEFTVKTDDVITLEFENTSINYPHTWVLVQPGYARQVAIQGEAAGPENDYLPDSPYVLAAMGMVPPGERRTITFRAPAEPGEYPYICTHPGHFLTMQGTLRVEEARQ